MVKDDIARLIREAIAAAQAAGRLPTVAVLEVPVERPTNPAFGDYATTLPMRLARAVRMAPLQIAQSIVEFLPPAPFLASAEVAPPGFINFRLSPVWLTEQVEAILAAGEAFGQVPLGQGQRVQVEFVSANPTGPLGVPNGRAAALGDTLANVLTLAGYQVSREYYVNDAGSRMEAFYQSVYARYLQELGEPAEVPPDGYHGAYLIELAHELHREYGDQFRRLPPEEGMRRLGEIALRRMVESARADLEALGVRYDVWFSEQSLYERSLVRQVIDLLRERGFVEEREGAVWFVSSALGEDKDNVLVRSNGVPTYFASDIAYHYDKFVLRGFDQVIDIWGADHMGHVPRMKAAMQALGLDPDRLKILIHQMVTLRRGAEIVRMSKRTGDIITLRELLEEVGRDACRFFFLSRSADTHIEFDLDLAKRQSNENPVYYVQYAHARIASILRYAASQGLEPAGGDVHRLQSDPELQLIRKMLQYPEVIEHAALMLAPHHLPYYAQDLATVFHAFYTQCRVVSEDLDLSRARLKLVKAAKTVLANCLRTMGVSAPEQM